MKTVLYLEDNENDAMLMIHAFKNRDVKIKWVSTAGAAFAELLCAAYDLIISDMLMPCDDGLRFIPSGDALVVEGTSKGKLAGKSWEGGVTPGGRFCNVFRFRDGLISSVHVYLDPDYTGDDEARFRWGKNRSW